MTDFSQILQREITPKENNETSNKKENINVAILPLPEFEKQPVEKPPKKQILIKKNKLRKKPGPKPKAIIVQDDEKILSHEAINPVWLALAEAAKLGGIQKKTIKRAIASKLLDYRIIENRYQVEFRSVILYLRSKKKLWNKFKEYGLGQYINKWTK